MGPWGLPPMCDHFRGAWSELFKSFLWIFLLVNAVSLFVGLQSMPGSRTRIQVATFEKRKRSRRLRVRPPSQKGAKRCHRHIKQARVVLATCCVGQFQTQLTVD